MKHTFRIFPFTLLIIACGAKEKEQDRTKIIQGNWALTTYQQHVLEFGKDSIYNREQRFYSTYHLFADSIEIRTKKYASINKYALSFLGNDTLILNGSTDGIHIYKRINAPK